MANPKYPKNYDDEETTTPPFLPNVSGTTDIAEYVSRLKKSIIVVERELGIGPSGAQATVSERLDLIETGEGNVTNHGESIHRVQIADKYSLNDVYDNYLVVGQVALNGLQETNLENSSTSEVTVIFKTHVYVQTNTILTTKLYDITTGTAKLLKEFVFNDGYSYVGGHFTKEALLNIVTDIPLSDRIYELRSLQTIVGTTTEEEKSVIWDSSLILKSTNTPVDDGYNDGYSGDGYNAIAVNGFCSSLTADGTAYFILPDGTEQADSGGTEPDISIIVARAGILRNLKVYLDQDPTNNLPIAIYIVPYGLATSAPTGLTCTVTTGAGPWFAEDTLDTLAVAAGDRLILRHVQPVGGTAVKLSAVFEII
jgi:hypothetical protein